MTLLLSDPVKVRFAFHMETEKRFLVQLGQGILEIISS